MKKDGGVAASAGLRHDDCGISHKAKSLFDRQLFLDILERHLSIGSSAPSRILLVKTEENLQPSS